MVYEYPATRTAILGARRRPALEAAFAELEEQAAEQLEDDGVSADLMVLQRIADARYEGQGYELRVDVGTGAIDAAWTEKLKSRFHDIHEREYSRRFDTADVQLANIRVRAIGPMPASRPPRSSGGGAARRGAAPRGRRVVPRRRRAAEGRDPVLRPRHCWPATSRGAGDRHQFDSTTVVPPGFTCTVDPVGHLVITYSDAAASSTGRGPRPRRSKEVADG